MTDTREAINRYCAAGWAPIPVPYRQKRPTILAWQELRIDKASVAQYWNGGPQNVGILLGTPSHGLTDVDLDSIETRQMAVRFLPVTRSIFGRRSSPRSHWLYYCDPILPTTKFQDPKKAGGRNSAMLVEFRSSDAQTVFPPSVHPSGQTVEWVSTDEPTRIDGNILLSSVSRLAAAALLARHWPAKGGRQEAALALHGGLLRGGWAAEDVAEFVGAVADAAGDEESAKRAGTTNQTARKVAQDRPTTGWPKLKTLIDPVIVDRVTDWLGLKFSSDDGARAIVSSRQPEPSDQILVEPPKDNVFPFPLHVLPLPLRHVVETISAALPCPFDFVAVPMLAALGVAIGNSRVVRIKAGWTEGPRIYAAIVADPGSKKSPALDLAIRPILRRQETYRIAYHGKKATYTIAKEQYENAYEQWKVRIKTLTKQGVTVMPAAPVEPAAPILAETYVTDTTMEAITRVLFSNPRGVLFFRDELIGWVNSMDAYRGGKGSDRQAWLSFWSGSPYKVNRKGEPEPIILHNPFIGVVGSLPPDQLPKLLDKDGREDGFVHRVLFTYPDPVPLVRTDKAITVETIDGYSDLVERLWALEPQPEQDGRREPYTVGMTREGQAAWNEWLDFHYSELADGTVPPELRGPWAKLEGYTGRLALILQEVRYAAGEADNEAIDADSVMGAGALAAYFKSHIERVYRSLRATKDDSEIASAVAFIEKAGGRVTLRDLIQRRVAGVRGRSAAEALIAKLVDRGLGTAEKLKQGGLAFLISVRCFPENGKHEDDRP